jgi:ribosome-binding factor A
MGRRRQERGNRTQIRDAQLCAEVRETLSLALAQSDDERLLALFVVDVVPAPDASRLLVQVEAPPGHDLGETHALLERMAGALRSEVAESVQRKRAPTLAFEVRPRPG